MIYLLTLNRIVELDLKTSLRNAGLPVQAISILEFPYLSFRSDDVLITSQKLIEKHKVMNSVESIKVIVLSTNVRIYEKLGLPANYKCVSIPYEMKELLELIK